MTENIQKQAKLGQCGRVGKVFHRESERRFKAPGVEGVKGLSVGERRSSRYIPLCGTLDDRI